MKRVLLRLLLVLVVLLLAALAGLGWMLQHPPSLAPYEHLRWPYGPAPAQAPLRMSFLGVATVLLDDGETALLTDGFFSRPGKLQTFVGKVEPDLDAITRGLARAGVPDRTGKLAAVIPLHSHYDHAMDAPEVARRTGALLVGSESTANVGRGWGLPESQMRVAVPGEPMRFGRFTITLFKGRHAPTGITGGSIDAPLKPPVRAIDYREGQTWIARVEHDGHTLLILGSAGFEPGQLTGVRADVVLLGIGALGPRPDSYRDALWNEVVTQVGARRVMPIHWDDFWIPSEGQMHPMPPPLDFFTTSMDFLRARSVRTGVQLLLPLEWTPMDPWAKLPAPRP